VALEASLFGWLLEWYWTESASAPFVAKPGPWLSAISSWTIGVTYFTLETRNRERHRSEVYGCRGWIREHGPSRCRRRT